MTDKERGMGDNSTDLTEEERKLLHFHHFQKISDQKSKVEAEKSAYDPNSVPGRAYATGWEKGQQQMRDELQRIMEKNLAAKGASKEPDEPIPFDEDQEAAE